MELTNVSLASLSLDSSTCNDIICGSNGLPLTPNSIRIIGDFKAQVEQVQHPNLTKYVECFRNKNGKCHNLDKSAFEYMTFSNFKNYFIPFR